MTTAPHDLSTADSPHLTGTSPYILLLIFSLGLSLLLWGIRRDLPYTPEVDEATFVERAIHIAATGDLNPHWFGHPGSTVIYPLAAIYHVQHIIRSSGAWFQPNPELQHVFAAQPGLFYLLGRLLSVTYSAGSLICTYLLGRRVFGQLPGMLGTWILAISPLVVSYGQIVRTDSAATFFGVASLWLCMRLLERPSLANQVWTGSMIGLAIATRYFLVALVPVLLCVNGYLTWKAVRQHANVRRCLLYGGIGLCAVIAIFALTTPYFFLDFPAVLADLRAEARDQHPGADGLSPLENFTWYTTTALPRSISWPLTSCALAGSLLSLWQRRIQPALLILFTLIFLIGISASPLHWDRWIIPCIPVFTLFAATLLVTCVRGAASRWQWDGRWEHRAIVMTILCFSIWPLWQVVPMDIRYARPSTRILARSWIEQHLPAGSRIAQEWYTAPLAGTDFVVLERFSLATNSSLEAYQRDGYQYIVVSSAMYGRFVSDPHRYPQEANFYQTLFATGRELHQFAPSRFRAGSLIRIFETPVSR